MTRSLYLATVFGMAALLFPASLPGQTYSIYAPGMVQTPEIHLGIADQPSLITIPPVLAIQPGLPVLAPPPEDFGPRAQACEPGAFDYIVNAPGAMFPGSMADASVSLGEYARELRSHKGEGPPPIHLEVTPSSQ